MIVEIAQGFAIAAHHQQKYGTRPYHYHLQSVVDVLKRHGDRDSVLFSAAWLHDVLEDTDVSEETLLAVFGPGITQLVKAVTDAPGATRAIRKAATYPQIRAGGATAVRLKLADRIANVSASIAEARTDLFGMYLREYASMKNELYRPGENIDMWGELDDLLKGTSRGH